MEDVKTITVGKIRYLVICRTPEAQQALRRCQETGSLNNTIKQIQDVLLNKDTKMLVTTSALPRYDEYYEEWWRVMKAISLSRLREEFLQLKHYKQYAFHNILLMLAQANPCVRKRK
jgi:hypothetical protein